MLSPGASMVTCLASNRGNIRACLAWHARSLMNTIICSSVCVIVWHASLDRYISIASTRSRYTRDQVLPKIRIREVQRFAVSAGCMQSQAPLQQLSTLRLRKPDPSSLPSALADACNMCSWFFNNRGRMHNTCKPSKAADCRLCAQGQLQRPC